MKKLGRLALLMILSPAGSLFAQTVSGYQEALESFRAGRYFEAFTMTRQLAEKDPLRPEFRHLHGLTLGALGQFTDAIAELDEAVRLAPERGDYWQDLGMTCLQSGQVTKARDALLEAVRINPSNSLARLYLGRLLHNNNRSEDAMKQFLAIEEIDDRFPTLHFHKARVFLSLGDGDSAVAELKREIANYPENPLPLLELVDLLLKSGDLAGARAHLDQLEKLGEGETEPHPPRFFRLKAKILQSEKRLDEAIAAAKESIRLDPTFARGYYLLGTLLREKGDLEGAQQALSQFGRLNEPLANRNP